MYHILEEIPLFEGIKPALLKEISQHVSLKKYKRNTCVICEGVHNENFYIIIKGEVRVHRTNRNDQNILLAILGEGEFFGELSILDENVASANVTTSQPSEFICIHDRQFLKIIKNNPRISRHMFCHMTQRIRNCDNCIQNLNCGNSFVRVGAVLIQLAEKNGYRRNGSVVIKQIPFQHNIASLAGTSRETVSRTFAELEENAYIIKSGRELVISDYSRFYEEFAQ